LLAASRQLSAFSYQLSMISVQLSNSRSVISKPGFRPALLADG
jgi:hypothetical protein